MNKQVLQSIQQCQTLPSLPAIAVQVLEVAQRDEVDLAEIARIISRDPALSTKILRTVNSSFYGRSQSISTLSRALVILGLQSVRTLVLGFSLVTTLTKTRAKGFRHMLYWRHSIFAATGARVIAGKLGVVQQEECFLVALMMDIGMLVLDQVLGEPYGQLMENLSTHEGLIAREKERLDATHAEVAGFLGESWKLPPVLIEPMAHHHEPSAVADPSLRRITQVVQFASLCADVYAEADAAEAIKQVRVFGATHFGMDEAGCDALLDEIGKRTAEVAPLFEVNIGSMMSYESILKRANEALVELTLRTQQQASTLVEQNQQLKIQATTDGLTQLANRATFDQTIRELFAKPLAERGPTAMVMMDIDKFKSVNDTYGHPAGDAVLRYVARLIKTAARAQDLAARYGGEEMVLLLPGTSRATATAITETIRRALAARPVQVGSLSLKITLSAGVAVDEPLGLFRDSTQLIRAADMSVYAAKHGGRNCVRVFAPQKTKVA